MKLAIMQPYAFPYLGYFQLIAAVDRFVLLDDVAYISRGWVNRNRILGTEGAHLFTIPLSGASPKRRICDIDIAEEVNWREKLLRTISQRYGKAPHFQSAWPVLEQILERAEGNLADWIRGGLRDLVRYLDIRTAIVDSASVYDNAELKGEERLIDICLREGAEEYINPEGGRSLYEGCRFRDQGVKLFFLEHETCPYEQFGAPFESSLSIIDVIMFNSKEELRNRLGEYRLVQ